ncbi:hypothetical protein NPIL_551881 [Nephila pilipes]|uniref:Uncharacterized protein n=1 Tax=Nephila pilipes TaxID=299642 RepID=A0A8X6TNL4_NEPPI|nr:hypothetical protein NPIL_551881 [Nephila pilipes]
MPVVINYARRRHDPPLMLDRILRNGRNLAFLFQHKSGGFPVPPSPEMYPGLDVDINKPRHVSRKGAPLPLLRRFQIR